MHVVVAIVSYKSADDISRCLEALKASDHTAFSVEVCENGGPEAFAALVSTVAALGEEAAGAAAGPDRWSGRLPGGQPIRLHRAPGNLGYAGGVNLCIGACAGSAWEALWVLNPDARPTASSLAEMLRHMGAGGYAMVGARLVVSGTGRVQLYGGKWRRLIARGYNIGLHQPADHRPDIEAVERQIDYVHGACMLVARSYIETVGLMNEDYFLYCEEVEWCLRGARYKRGYAHDALVYHDHGTAMGSSLKRAARSRLSVYLDERNRLLLSRRQFPALYPLIVLTTLLLTAQYLRHGAVRNFGHALTGWWAGIRGETGRPAWFDALGGVGRS